MAKTKGMNTRLHHRLYDKIIYKKVKAEVPAISISAETKYGNNSNSM